MIMIIENQKNILKEYPYEIEQSYFQYNLYSNKIPKKNIKNNIFFDTFLYFLKKYNSILISLYQDSYFKILSRLITKLSKSEQKIISKLIKKSKMFYKI